MPKSDRCGIEIQSFPRRIWGHIIAKIRPLWDWNSGNCGRSELVFPAKIRPLWDWNQAEKAYYDHYDFRPKSDRCGIEIKWHRILKSLVHIWPKSDRCGIEIIADDLGESIPNTPGQNQTVVGLKFKKGIQITLCFQKGQNQTVVGLKSGSLSRRLSSELLGQNQTVVGLKYICLYIFLPNNQ